MAEHSPAPSRPDADNVPKRATSAGLSDSLPGKRARLYGGRESLLLIGIPVGYFVGDMIGDCELVGVPGNEIHPVDAKEVHQH